MKKGITIFTPTYNRAYVLNRLYDSLARQTDKHFEWIIIDDGSSDNTRNLADKWISEQKIRIRYYYQKNSGKMQAHNKGTKLAEYELFCCVDSDDYLSDKAVEEILNCWRQKKNNGIIGLLNYKINAHGDNVSGRNLNDLAGNICTLLDAYRKYGLNGDTMLIYRTDVIRKHHFPRFEEEKFVPELFLYDQLDQKGMLYIQGRNLYICEYLPDGYSHNIRSLNANNPRGYEAYIKQRLRICRGEKTIKNFIRLEAIEFRLRQLGLPYDFDKTLKGRIAIPAGYVFYLYAYKNVKYEP